MVKIETNNTYRAGKEIAFCDNIKVKFDHLGKAELEDDKAEILLKNYPESIFKEGTHKEEKKVDIYNEANEAALLEINKLNNDVLKLEKKNKKLSGINENLESQVKEWKALYDKSNSGTNKEDEKLSKRIKELESENNILLNKTKLLSVEKQELIAIAKEQKFPKKEWDTLNRVELVDYLGNKLS